MKKEGPLERAALRALRREVKEGRLHVAAPSWPLLLELSGLYEGNQRLWRRALCELTSLAGRRILLERPARVEREVRLGRRLRRREIFYPRENAENFYNRFLKGESVREGFQHILKVKEEYKKQERESQAAVRERMGSGGRAEWIAAWRVDASSIVLDWCADGMRAMLGGETKLPEARELPSMWHWWSYLLARIYLVAVEAEGPRKVDPNDMMDHDHYADAAYSRIFVTCDGRLQAIARQCPEPKVRVVDFREWAVSLASA